VDGRQAPTVPLGLACPDCVPESQQPLKQPLDQNEEGHLSDGHCNFVILMRFMAPEVGLEPTTLRLTGGGDGFCRNCYS
jgi:hypothetical protein